MELLERTHCSKGHDLSVVGRREYTPAGRAKPRIYCNECGRIQSRESAAKAREALADHIVYPQTPQEVNRFLGNVERNVRTGCWEWNGARQAAGYGVVTIRSVVLLAHRASYLMTHSQIPNGLELDHLCRNKSCVNPDHLEPVTHEENMRRAPGWNHRRETCKRGHRNWANYPSGRQCRTCNIERKAAQRAAR